MFTNFDQKFDNSGTTTLKPQSTISIQKFPWILNEFWIRAIGLSTDNERILIGTHNSNIYEINLRKPEENPKLVTSGHAEGELWGLAVDRKGELIASGGDDQTLRFWSQKNHKLINVKIFETKVRSCAFNNDGTQIAVGLANGQLVILNAKDFAELTKIREHERPIQELIFSPDGEILAFGCDDGTVNFHQVKQNYKKIGLILVNSKQMITHIDWSADGKFIRVNTDRGKESFYSVSSTNSPRNEGRKI